jgi:hypothetical protein
VQDRPTASELLETIGDLLEGPVLEATQGALKHQVRVAGNLCRILGREQLLGREHDAAEVAALAALLHESAEGKDAVSLSDALATQLREASDPDFEARAWPVLLEIVRGKLAIAKPGHTDYDFGAESEATS